jgi:hypothetical protein
MAGPGIGLLGSRRRREDEPCSPCDQVAPAGRFGAL